MTNRTSLSLSPPERALSELGASLFSRRGEFLSYVERRVGDRTLAEDILQNAFVKSLEAASSVAPEARVSWFYRVLRNATVDHHRNRARSIRALESLSNEIDVPAAEQNDRRTPCSCVSSAVEGLKREHADIVQRVDVGGLSLREYAAMVGITATNARVRAFRAREALRTRLKRGCGECASDGCTDCTCRPSHDDS